MASRGGSEPPPPPPPELTTFKKLVEACSKRPVTPSQHKFVKKMESISSVALPTEEPCLPSLNIVERGLICQFMGLWPSPKSIEAWVQSDWRLLVSEGIESHLVGKGYFVFIFDNVGDINLIFRNIPSFMGP
jgi:hypothetical protein